MPKLEERVQRLEDIEEIRRLKVRYAQAVDAGFDVDTLMSLFTDDAVLDGGSFGVSTGSHAIREFYERNREELTFTRHFLCGSVIDIDPSGTEASGQWYLWEVGTFKGEAILTAITYDDTYRKVNDSWKFAHKKLNIAFFTPYDKGWVKQAFVE